MTGRRPAARHRTAQGRRRWRLALTAAAALAAPAQAQDLVPLDEVRDHVNRFVTVEATVARVFRSGRDTWVSLGKAYPAAPLVIVIPSSLVSAIPNLQSYRGKLVRITGRIEPPIQEGPPGRTRNPADAAPARMPSKPYVRLEDPGMLVLLGSPP